MRRLVNRVSVEASFFKKMSAAENLAYAARFYGMGPRETHAKIPVILERVGFPSARRGEAMENLSRGMQQKVALARALLTSPVLLLLDEPTTGLDPRSKQEVQNFIREIRQRARLDDPALHARHERGRGARRPDRPARPRRAAVPRAGRGRSRSATASRRSRRRSSPRPAARTRTSTPKRTKRERCSHDNSRTHLHAQARAARRADRPVRRRRAQPLPDQALPALGPRVPALDDRQHADDRVHLARRRPVAGGAERARDEAARRRRHLGVPRDHLRDRHRDGRVGALGRNDRVHVHGARCRGRCT